MQTNSTTESQKAVAIVLKRLGYLPKLEVPLFDGVVTVDIVFNLSRIRSETTNGKEVTVRNIAIEFDGPCHFMKKAKGATEHVGTIDVRTRLRNSLIEKSGEFVALLVIPFYEWDKVWEKRIEKKSIEKGCSRVHNLAMAYLKGKIEAIREKIRDSHCRKVELKNVEGAV